MTSFVADPDSETGARTSGGSQFPTKHCRIFPLAIVDLNKETLVVGHSKSDDVLCFSDVRSHQREIEWFMKTMQSNSPFSA
jgi:hypothetical protein